MSLLTRIAHRLAAENGIEPEMISGNVYMVKFKDKLAVYCEGAEDQQSQVVGMQKYSSIPKNFGMIFPYTPSKSVSFHMGSTQFPLDIIFIDGNRVIKVLHDVQPESRDTLPSGSRVSYVVELYGGTCKESGINVGCPVNIKQVKISQEKFEPSHNRTDQEPRQPQLLDESDNRFKSRDLVDVQTDGQPMDTNREESEGYVRDDNSLIGPNVRPGA